MNKNIFLIIIILFTGNIIYSQTPKYDDIIDIVNQKKYMKAYSLLFQYQQSNPEFPNTYFQLGNISYYWATNSDPLTDMNQTEFYIYNTKLYYGLCTSKLQKEEKDAKKNSKLYKTIPEFENIDKLDNSIVTSYINTKLEDITEYDKDVHESAKYFHNLIRKYNETVDIFLSIIERYDKLKDIYLEQNSSILKSTNDLILSFDSTLLYFEQYKISINNYPIKNYNQSLNLRPIKTYRLQGITRTNFLKDSILIWDYKSWAKDIQDNLGSNISHFRTTIIKTNKELASKELELQNSTKFSNSYTNYEIDQKVLFETEKFDYNSLISNLFTYRKAKIDFLVQEKRIYNDTSNYSVSANNRAIEYYTLTENKIKADSLLKELKTKTTEENYYKHKDFFDFNYQGYNGLVNYISKEEIELSDYYTNALKNLQYFTYRDVFQFQSKPAKTNYKNKNINLFVDFTEPNIANPNEYYTLAVDENKNGDKYLAGFFKTVNGSSAFIAKVSNNQIEWIKNTSSGTNAFEYGTTIKATPEGCVAIIHTNYQNKHQNSVIRLNSNGKQVYKKSLTNSNITRYIDYDEINEVILLAFQSETLDNYSQTEDSLYIEKLDINTNKALWKQQILLDGQLINIIKMDTIYHVITNYHRVSIEGDNFLNTKNNMLIINFTTNGKYLSSTELNSDHFICGVYAYKINSETINIIGYNSKINNKKTKYKDLPSPYYILINNSNKTIFQNL